MVLGLRSKHRRGASVRVTYIVHIHEIKPWPPSESLRSIQTVLLQWENGSDYSGSFLTTARDSKLVFNESFKLPLLLYQDRKAHDKFQKNYLEFSLFLPRKDKAKGQLLGTAVLNLADYGVIEHTLSINAAVNFKKSSSKSVQSVVVTSLEPVRENSSNTSPNVGLSREPSLDHDNDDGIASFTDDDASSQSSRTAGSSTIEVATFSPSKTEKHGNGNSGFVPEQSRNVWPSTTDALSDTGNQVTDDVSFSKFYGRSTTSVMKNSDAPVIRPSHSSISRLDTKGMPNTIVASSVHKSVSHNSHEVIADSKYRNTDKSQQSVEGTSFERFSPQPVSVDNNTKVADNSNSADSLNFHDSQELELQPENVQINDPHVGLLNVEDKMEAKDSGLDDRIMEEMKQFPEKKLIGNLSEDANEGVSTTVSSKAPEVTLPISNEARIRHVNSLRVHGAVKGNGHQSGIYAGGKALDPDISDGCQKEGELDTVVERKEPTKDELPECRNEWKSKIEMFEEELTEAAASEVGLYSVVAEHASSGNKVHAPARRLSRFYSNACKAGSQAKRASAARAAVSGLVLVSKACGHDVPRLTFWLSNTIMLRAIVSQIAAELPHSDGLERKSNGTGSELTGRLPHQSEDYSYTEENNSKNIDESDDREDISTFIIALEKVESWLFSRIVESLWWQTFTPHMQPTVASCSDATLGSGTKKTCGRRSSLGNNYERGNFSAELWKKAFKDACERLCPIRAGGLDCGCLSVLVRLVMEQLVNRLDMAMFNAILRESAEEMPTDPVSDPISDPKVLPIPAGKSSFGAGVELKNSIGTWSRWLTDLFGLEDDSTELIDESPESFKAFRLLHALSDLMMLPLGMLADAPTRKEVCPMFGPTIIKRVLNSFVPDEFCPDPIPQNVIDALDTEEVTDASGDILATFPCTASPTKYSPPPAALLTCVGEVGSQVLQSSRLSTLRKSYISDDELDELDSPFTSIIPDSFQGSALAKLGLIPKSKGGRDIIRYKLLREIWKDDE